MLIIHKNLKREARKRQGGVKQKQKTPRKNFTIKEEKKFPHERSSPLHKRRKFVCVTHKKEHRIIFQTIDAELLRSEILEEQERLLGFPPLNVYDLDEFNDDSTLVIGETPVERQRPAWGY